jgi:hypothetical protein
MGQAHAGDGRKNNGKTIWADDLPVANFVILTKGEITKF